MCLAVHASHTNLVLDLSILPMNSALPQYVIEIFNLAFAHDVVVIGIKDSSKDISWVVKLIHLLHYILALNYSPLAYQNHSLLVYLPKS